MIVRSWSVWEGSIEAGGLPGVYLFKSLVAIFAVAFFMQFLSLFLKNIKQESQAFMSTEILEKMQLQLLEEHLQV